MIKALFIIATTLLITASVTIIHAARSDPFSRPGRHAGKRLAHPMLKGIVRQGERCGALLAHGRETEIVFEGDNFASYTVKQVDQQQVCLIRGAQQIILTLEEKKD